MKKYRYSCSRSQKPEHQIQGMACTAALMDGELYAKDNEEAWDLVGSLLMLPGVWTCELSDKAGMLGTRDLQVER